MLDCVTVMMHCIRQEASMLAKQVSCVFTTEESRAKIWLQYNAFRPPSQCFHCCPFLKASGYDQEIPPSNIKALVPLLLIHC